MDRGGNAEQAERPPLGHFCKHGTPYHHEKTVQGWLAANTPSFFDKDEWPPNSPDLNPLDYYLWGRLEALVNTKRFESVDSLKAAITSAWMRLDNEEVAAACAEFRDRLKLCVQAGGKHFRDGY